MSDVADIQPPAVDPLDESTAREINERYSKLLRQKRSDFLTGLQRDLDTLIYCLLSYLYFLDCSFFRLVFRSALQMGFLSPRPQSYPSADQGRPAIITFFGTATISLLWHVLTSAPSAGELTNGYLHGGLLIDFVGQEGPISKCRLAFLDIVILFLQLTMLAVVVAKRDHDFETERVESRRRSPPSPPLQDLESEERGLARRHSEPPRASTEGEGDVRPEEEEQTLLMTGGEPVSVSAALERTVFGIFAGEFVVADINIIDEMKRQWREGRGGAEAEANAARRS